MNLSEGDHPGVALLDRVGLTPPPSLLRLWQSPPSGIADRYCDPARDTEDSSSLVGALDTMDLGAHEPPAHFVPIAAIDERSFAVVVCSRRGEPHPNAGHVLRWHLDDIPLALQSAPLDRDPEEYATSLAEELAARQAGLDRMRELGAAYDRQYTRTNERPKAYVVRPMQLACQNVVVGLAAVAHDTGIDGERVELWQTCEVPHLAAHEANRALAAVLLCDAFQNGGTMEIRFDGSPTRRDGTRDYEPHPEGRVPASLRRFARSRGFCVGESDPAAISPSEARQLFRAITPMSAGLRARVDEAVARGVASPERLCFVLLMPVWRGVELDFLLGCSSRVGSILAGGADPWRRSSRMAEAEACRAAVLTGMYFRRLDGRDTAAGGSVRTFEDNRQGVEWELLPESGAVLFRGVRDEPLPWSGGDLRPSGGAVIVLPRAHPIPDDVELARELSRRTGLPTVVAGAADSIEPNNTPHGLLRAPDRVGELDLDVERRLTAARGART